MNRAKLTTEKYYLAIVFFVATSVILPIVIFGIPDGYDLPQHYQFAQTFYESITKGVGFPGWSGRENYGYGGVGIRFYPPLAYYALAFGRILTGNWFDASWLIFTLWMVIGCFGIYYWLRWWFSAKESALAACFYAIIPFHLNQLYSAFNYSEFAASAILPFCFAYLTRVFQRDKISDVIGLAVFYGLLIITHLPLGLIGSISLFVYSLTMLRKKNLFQSLLKSFIGAILGLALSAFYWVGMISEMKWLNHASEQYSSGQYGFSQGFFPLYLHSSETNRLLAIILADLMIVLSFGFVLSAVFYFIYKKNNLEEISKEKGVFQTVLPLALFAFFMVTPFSKTIWQILTPLQKVQLPMRWMPVVSMCGAILAGASFRYLLKGNLLKKRFCSYSCLIFLSIVAVYNIVYLLSPTSFAPISRESFETKINALPEEESFVCWWTIWAKADALKVKEKVLVEERETKILAWESEKRVFEVEAGNTATARLATFYYPLWQATVNGKKVEIEKDENGAMLIPIGNQHSKVELDFQEPQTVKFASKLSIFTLVLIIIAGLILLRKNRFFSFKRR